MSEDTLDVYWDHAVQINVGAGRQLVELPAGKSWPMPADEALARIEQGNVSPADPKAHAKLLKARAKSSDQETQPDATEAETTGETVADAGPGSELPGELGVPSAAVGRKGRGK